MENENSISNSKLINETESKKYSSSDKSSIRFVKFSFLIFGICSLIEWNAILSDIDFFHNKQEKINPKFSFSFFNSFLNIIVQFILVYKPKPFQYKKQLLFTLISTFFILILLPLNIIIFNGNSNGFFSIAITIILILFGGLCNALGASGFFGLCSYFPLDLIINMSTGQGFAGILTNIIEYLILLFKPSDNANAICFFGIVGLIVLLSLFIIIRVYQIPFFLEFLKNTDEIKDNINIKIGKLINEESREEIKEDKLIFDKDSTNLNEKEDSFYELTKQLIEINILVIILYITTFVLFPGVCLVPGFFGLGDSKAITIISIYNVFDTIGRYIVNCIEPTKFKAYVIILTRTILIFIMPYIAHLEKIGKSDLLVSLMLLFCVLYLGVSNGIGTSLCFGLAPNFVKPHMKGKAGSSVSFFLIVGIFSGSLLAIIMGWIMDKIKKKDD